MSKYKKKHILARTYWLTRGAGTSLNMMRTDIFEIDSLAPSDSVDVKAGSKSTSTYMEIVVVCLGFFLK